MGDRQTRAWVGVALGIATAAAAAAQAGAVAVDVGTARGAPGDTVSIAVTLEASDAAVLATQNRIDFPRAVVIPAQPSGDPDCRVNPDIDKGATAFRFLPPGCDPAVDCESVRAFVLAFDNLHPIPDGATLYTCRVVIAADAGPGTYVLGNAEVGASAPGGQLLPTSGADGAVTVEPPPLAPVVAIAVGEAAGTPGATVDVAVSLHVLSMAGEDVVAVEHSFGFDSATPVAAARDGRPDCAANPNIGKEATVFGFLPEGCTPGADCRGLRALVLSFANTAPIADGSVLHTCRIAIDPAAAVGRHPLPGTRAAASGADGRELGAEAVDGAVEVVSDEPPCTGDCNGDRQVAINELLLGVNQAVGAAAIPSCPSFDADGDGVVAVNEVVQAVGNALAGCQRPDPLAPLVDDDDGR